MIWVFKLQDYSNDILCSGRLWIDLTWQKNKCDCGRSVLSEHPRTLVCFSVREWLIWLGPLMLCWHHVAVTLTAPQKGADKAGRCERLGFVAVYSSAQTTHSSPADFPAPLLVCRIDEPSTQVSSHSLYIDKAIMHASLLCITVSSLSRQMGCQDDTFPHTSALCCEEDVDSNKGSGLLFSARWIRVSDPPTAQEEMWIMYCKFPQILGYLEISLFQNCVEIDCGIGDQLLQYLNNWKIICY